MNHLIQDSHRLITHLTEKYGYSKEQAEGLKFAIDEIQIEHVATQTDVERLRADLMTSIERLRSDLFKWLVPLLVGQVAIFAAVIKWIA